MSINDDEGIQESVTEEYRALKYFTDRFGLTRHFSRHLHSDPMPKKILFLHGDGGNGKSLLLRYWFEKACFRFADWETVDAIADDRKFVEKLERLGNRGSQPILNAFNPVLAAFHDFGQAGSGEQQPQDNLYGPFMIRKALARAAQNLNLAVEFPHFDFAVAWYFHRHGKSKEEINRIFAISDGDSEFLSLIDCFLNLPVCSMSKSAIKLARNLNEREVEALMRNLKVKSKLDKDWVVENCQLDPDRDLIPRLSAYLAEDLNTILKKLPEVRIVLLFDTHEAFWGTNRDEGEALYFARDKWLRQFLLGVDLDKGILPVVSGREIPRWHEAGEKKIRQKYLDIQLVSHFTPIDACEYLNKLRIEDSELQTAMLKYASVTLGEIQPFLLGLCADIVLAARSQGGDLEPRDFPEGAVEANKPRETIQRLTKYINANLMLIVDVLSACRTFNLEIFQTLADHFKFSGDLATFKIICRFSFVWKEQNREGWYRIHDLIRRLNDESPPEETKKAHVVLEHYHRRNGDLVGAIFHANRVHWKRGLREWLERFKHALEQSQYQLCAELQSIALLLFAKDNTWFWQGRLSQSQGDYFATLSKHLQAQESYCQAVSFYDRVLELNPKEFNACNNKGNALRSLGDLRACQSHYKEAQEIYCQAVMSYDRAIKLASTDVYFQNNKSHALWRLGDLQTQQLQFKEAQESYRQALISCDRALKLCPEFNIYSSRGNVLTSLGDLQARQLQYGQAQESYHLAIISYDRSLKIMPDDVDFHNNKGIVLSKLGNLQTYQLQYQKARESYRQAFLSFDCALKLAPNNIFFHRNKGNLFRGLGDLQIRQSQFQKAQESYHQALASYDCALKLSPADIESYNNKGNAWRCLGDLQVRQLQYHEAKESYYQAASSYDCALQLAPSLLNALKSKAFMLPALSQLDPAKKVQHLQAALICIEASLKVTPNDGESISIKQQILSFLDSDQAD